MLLMNNSFQNIEQAIDQIGERFPGTPRQEVILNRLFCHIKSRLTCHWNETLKPYGLNETLWIALITRTRTPSTCCIRRTSAKPWIFHAPTPRVSATNWSNTVGRRALPVAKIVANSAQIDAGRRPLRRNHASGIAQAHVSAVDGFQSAGKRHAGKPDAQITDGVGRLIRRGDPTKMQWYFARFFRNSIGESTVNRQPWQQGFNLLILTTVLSGCAGFGPEHTPASLLTPTQLSLPAAQETAPAQGWWQQLHDPELNKLIDTALNHSPSLQLAEDRLGEARSAVKITKSRMGPQVDLNGVEDRQRLSGTNATEPLPIGGNFYNFYTLTLDASWEIDFWGKNRAQTKAALGQMRAATLEAQQARLVLTQAVIGQYTALQRQLQQQQIADARIRIAETRIKLMQARVSAGMLSADTVDQAITALAGLRSQDELIAGDIQRSRHALSALTGQAPSALDALSPALLADTPRLDETALTADLLGRRPDIASQRARVEAMEESVKAARAEFYPNVSLSAFAGVNSTAFSTLFDHSSRIVDVGPAISLPIFHSGQLQGNLRREQSLYDQAVDSYNQAVLDGLKNAAERSRHSNRPRPSWSKPAMDMAPARKRRMP